LLPSLFFSFGTAAGQFPPGSPLFVAFHGRVRRLVHTPFASFRALASRGRRLFRLLLACCSLSHPKLPRLPPCCFWLYAVGFLSCARGRTCGGTCLRLAS
jgi:hypothetical protein